MKLVLAAVTLLLLTTACTTDLELHQYGVLQEVLRDGKTEARISPVEVCSENSWGVGALAGLEGEITISDGDVSVSANGMKMRDATIDDQATMCFYFDVEQWQSIVVEKDVKADELSSYIQSKNRSGLFPFRIEGQFSNLDFHVIVGSCPMQGGKPLRASIENISGQIVGIYADGKAGEVTHHGQKTHMHIITEEHDPRMGHVDAVGVKKGSKIYFPK